VRSNNLRQKDNSTPIAFKKEFIISLTLDHRTAYTRHHRTSHIVDPPIQQPSTKAVPPSPKPKDKRIEVWDFDDTLFFSELNHEYGKLAGPFRHFSARSLQTIRPTYSSSAESNIKCRWNNDFSEKEMMTLFRSPKRGKGKYV
jgi:hypothetical protein